MMDDREREGGGFVRNATVVQLDFTKDKILLEINFIFTELKSTFNITTLNVM